MKISQDKDLMTFIRQALLTEPTDIYYAIRAQLVQLLSHEPNTQTFDIKLIIVYSYMLLDIAL